MKVPKGASIEEFPILASWGLDIGAGSEIVSDSLVANAVNTGDGPTIIGAGKPIRTWIENATDLGSDDGLLATMKAADVKWCDICDIYALHNGDAKNLGGTQSKADRAARQNFCINSLASFIGPPPSADGRFDADTCEPCADDEIVQDGECVPCGDNAVRSGNSCTTCPALTVLNTLRTACEPCPSQSIWVAGSPPHCEDCPDDSGATADNRCAPCDADAVLVAQDTCVGGDIFSTATAPHPGDNCPREFWVEVQNLGALNGGSLKVTSEPETDQSSELECASTSVDLNVFQPIGAGRWDYARPHRNGETGTWNACGPSDDPNFLCPDRQCTFPGLAFETEGSALSSGPASYRFVGIKFPAFGNSGRNEIRVELRSGRPECNIIQ